MCPLHRYSEEEIVFLREHVSGTLFNDLTAMFNQRFGTNVTKWALQAACRRHNLHSGVKVFDVLRAAGKTHKWEKGHRPHTWRPLGSEIIFRGHTFVKISEKISDRGVRRWRPKEAVVWEQAHGTVPDKHFVIFLDGDKQNFALDNLVIINKAEDIALKKLGLQHSTNEILLAALAVVKMRIAVKKRERERRG
jgi:hypothetical protein